MSRVSFPLFSRLQDDHKSLPPCWSARSRFARWERCSSSGLVFGLGPNIVEWCTPTVVPALPLFYVYAAVFAFGFLTPLVAPALDATGPAPDQRTILDRVDDCHLSHRSVYDAALGSLGFVAGYCLPMVLGNVGIIIVLKSLIPQAKLWPRVRAAIAGGLVWLP